ncbi:FAD/NAD-P-binding domain-containing protein [Cyathus striatus]|nr:FAD/NAD-P-binding domain-containing protein [Cyathus striatus]
MSSNPSPRQTLRIAICGGGIGGLCLALALSRHAHLQVDIYEATQRFKEIGAGVMIWSRTWRILELMGLAPAFSLVAHASPDGSMGVGFNFRRSDSSDEGFQFHLAEMPYGCIRFHRADFLDVFVDHLPSNVAHFGKRLVSYSQTHENAMVTLHFEDGDTAICDVLAQEERNSTLLRHVNPVWTGIIAYRGLIDIDKIPKSKLDEPDHRAIRTPMMYCGPSKHVVSYSICRGNIINVVTFTSASDKYGVPYNGDWVVECPAQELRQCYAGWEPEVVSLLELVEHPTRWAIHHLNELPCYIAGSVVLMGDAAHAMTPHQGAGAGQAIEDAFILSSLLAQASPKNVGAALAAYETVRLSAANEVLRESYRSGMMYEFISEFGEDYERLGPAIQKQWDWIDRTTPEQDRMRALELFKLNEQRSRL